MPPVTSKVIMHPKEPSKDEVDFFEKTLKQYGDILATYVILTSSIENEIEILIATFYFFEDEEKNKVIEFLVVDMTLSKKIRVLQKLIKRHDFKNIDKTDLEKTFKIIERIVGTRNKLVHSTLLLNKKNDRISYQNKSHSFRDKLFITKQECEADKDILFNCLMKLWQVKHETEDLKYREQSRVRLMNRLLSEKIK